MAGLLTLNAAAHLINGGKPQTHHVEGVEHPHRSAQHATQGGGLAAIGVQRSNTDAGPPRRLAVGDPAD